MEILIIIIIIISISLILFQLTRGKDLNEKNSGNDRSYDFYNSYVKTGEEIEKEELAELKKEFANQGKFEKYKNLTEEDVVLDKNFDRLEKIDILRVIFKYSEAEATKIVTTAVKMEEKERLRNVKRKISRKIQENYHNMPCDERRISLSDEVKSFVWNRDKGRCVKCGSQEKLEFDHIIPFSKGGSDTARNIQILCESCNRSKSDNI